MENYYFSQMTRPEQEIYRTLLRAFQSCAREAELPTLENGMLTAVYSRLMLDHPEIFWIRSFKLYRVSGAEHIRLCPDYLFDKGKLKAQQQTVTGRLDRLTRPMMSLSEAEKLEAIHRFILENVRYDKLKKEYSHEVFGPMCMGVGVCEGIAKTVKLMCDRVGLDCIVVLCEADPEHGAKYRHAWNLVKTGGKWHHLDATFDLTLSACGQARYDYYNLSDAQIFRDHRSSIYRIPEASDGGSFYYKCAGRSFTKYEDVSGRIAQALRKKQPEFVLHWRGGYLTREVLAELLRLAAEKAAERGLLVRASVNFPQAVVCLQFGQESAELTEETAEQSD